MRLAGTDEARALLAEWRSVFARRLNRSTGDWVHLGVDWHVFSYEFARCVEGEEAVTMFERERCAGGGFVVICDPNVRLSAYLEETGEIPRSAELEAWNYDLGHYKDLYVCPRSLDWTFVLTHERDAGFGPYFALRDWQLKN